MIKVLCVFICFSLFLGVHLVFATDSSIDSSQSNRIDREKSQTLRKTKETRDSKGKRKTRTQSIGEDKQLQDAIRQGEQLARSSGAEVSVDIMTLFLQKAAELERRGDNSIFGKCQVISHPKLPPDFGITSQKGKAIDIVRADYIQRSAASSARFSTIGDEEKLIQYRDCMTEYGGIIGQAYLNFLDDIATIATFRKEKDNEVERIEGINYDELVRIASETWDRTIRDGITSQAIRDMVNTIRRDYQCVFDRSVEHINCGGSSITLSSSPSLIYGAIQFYGGKYAGFTGIYRVSTTWSYSRAIELLRSTTRYARIAQEVASYTEQLEAQGKVRDAVMVRKNLWELAKTGKSTVSLNNLLPTK